MEEYILFRIISCWIEVFGSWFNALDNVNEYVCGLYMETFKAYYTKECDVHFSQFANF